VEAAINDPRTVWENPMFGNITARLILWYSFETSEETNDSVYKLTTNKLQPVLINMII